MFWSDGDQPNECLTQLSWFAISKDTGMQVCKLTFCELCKVDPVNFDCLMVNGFDHVFGVIYPFFEPLKVIITAKA